MLKKRFRINEVIYGAVIERKIHYNCRPNDTMVMIHFQKHDSKLSQLKVLIYSFYIKKKKYLDKLDLSKVILVFYSNGFQ